MAYSEKEQAVLERVKKAPFPTDYKGLREAINSTIGGTNAKPPEIGAFHEDVELRPGLRADISVPKGAGPHPIAIYLHGGGWVAGSSKSHRKLGMQFAEAGYLTLNVDYRLAPEHPFPAGLDDAVFAVRWAHENAKRYNGDAARIVIGGDSAGANLAAAAALGNRQESGRRQAERAAVAVRTVRPPRPDAARRGQQFGQQRKLPGT